MCSLLLQGGRWWAASRAPRLMTTRLVPQLIGEEEDVSVYDIADHPDFRFRTTDIVIRIGNTEDGALPKGDEVGTRVRAAAPQSLAAAAVPGGATRWLQEPRPTSPLHSCWPQAPSPAERLHTAKVPLSQTTPPACWGQTACVRCPLGPAGSGCWGSCAPCPEGRGSTGEVWGVGVCAGPQNRQNCGWDRADSSSRRGGTEVPRLEPCPGNAWKPGDQDAWRGGDVDSAVW